MEPNANLRIIFMHGVWRIAGYRGTWFAPEELPAAIAAAKTLIAAASGGLEPAIDQYWHSENVSRFMTAKRAAGKPWQYWRLPERVGNYTAKRPHDERGWQPD